MSIDSPHWSYLHGCKIHPGFTPPCSRCIAENHPDLVRSEESLAPVVKPVDSADMVADPGPHPLGAIDEAYRDYYADVSDERINDIVEFLLKPKFDCFNKESIFKLPEMPDNLFWDMMRIMDHEFMKNTRALFSDRLYKDSDHEQTATTNDA